MKNITQMFCYIAQKVFLQTYKKAYFVGRGIQNSEKHQKTYFLHRPTNLQT